MKMKMKMKRERLEGRGCGKLSERVKKQVAIEAILQIETITISKLGQIRANIGDKIDI
jgi:hypothetical protein